MERESTGGGGASGWDAISGALAAVHGDAEPRHVGMAPGVAFGSPLQGLSAFPAADHWHFVTYGLTELFEKESDEPKISGLGYELTMRVVRGTADGPPHWAFDLLAKVAEAARSTHDFHAGHRLSVGGPITGQPGCDLHALAFVTDPSLPTWTSSPNGSFEFYQLVGITAGQLAEMQASSTDAVIERIASRNPLLVTDPSTTR